MASRPSWPPPTDHQVEKMTANTTADNLATTHAPYKVIQRSSAEPVDLGVVCIAMWMKSTTLHQLQQASNVKEEQDWSVDRTLRHSK